MTHDINKLAADMLDVAKAHPHHPLASDYNSRKGDGAFQSLTPDQQLELAKHMVNKEIDNENRDNVRIIYEERYGKLPREETRRVADGIGETQALTGSVLAMHEIDKEGRE